MAYIRPLDRAASEHVLVVGGGIAAVQAALEVAVVGLPVTLVEEGPAIGGMMAQSDKTFPTNDCAMCILSPRMLEVARHPAIQIRTLTRVLELEGRGRRLSGPFESAAPVRGAGQMLRLRRVHPGLPPKVTGPL